MRAHFFMLITPAIVGLLAVRPAHAGEYVIHDLGALTNGGYAPEVVAGHYIVPIQQEPMFMPPDRYVILSENVDQIAALGTFGGDRTIALAQNHRGETVGMSDVPQIVTPDYAAAPHHAFSVIPGKPMTDLGTFTTNPLLDSTAYGISDRGWVVGSAAVDLVILPDGEAAPQHAFLHDGHDLLDLGTLSTDPVISSTAYGVNARGQVVGSAGIGVFYEPGAEYAPQHAFLWQNGAMQDLGTLSTNPVLSSVAYGINDAGCVVGTAGYQIAKGDGWEKAVQHAFTYTAAGGVSDLGTLGGFDSSGYAIDPAGRVIGKSNLPAASGLPWDQEEHAVVWDHSAVIDLGALAAGRPSSAYGFDGQGRIYGLAFDINWQLHLVSWERDHGAHGGHG